MSGHDGEVELRWVPAGNLICFVWAWGNIVPQSGLFNVFHSNHLDLNAFRSWLVEKLVKEQLNVSITSMLHSDKAVNHRLSVRHSVTGAVTHPYRWCRPSKTQVLPLSRRLGCRRWRTHRSSFYEQDTHTCPSHMTYRQKHLTFFSGTLALRRENEHSVSSDL